MTSRFSKLSTTDLVETHERLDGIAKDLAFAYDEIAMLRKDFPRVNFLISSCCDISNSIALIDIVKKDLENEIIDFHVMTDEEYSLLADS